MLTKKCGVWRNVHANARNKPPEHLSPYVYKIPRHRPFRRSLVCNIYCVVTIQSGSIDWINGEFVIRASVPSEALMPKAEMLEDPTLATYRNVLETSTVRNIGCGVPTEPVGCTK